VADEAQERLVADLNAVVALRDEISPWLMVLRVAPDGWALPDFRPGQFAVVGLPGSAPRHPLADPEDAPRDPAKIIRRAYSISSSSLTREYVEFYIALVTSGALTPRLFALQMGDRLWLSPKVTGLFTLDRVAADRHVVLIATGTGLAPYMSMLTTHLVCDGDRKFAVLHGARHSWDLGFRAELQNLARMCPNFSYTPVISRPQQEHVAWSGNKGYVQDLWRSGAVEQAWGIRPTPDNTQILLCGSPSMIDDTIAILGAEGFVEDRKHDRGQIHVERYW
jgi:ferredoxin/flavodoxin---NADP+ reductase